MTERDILLNSMKHIASIENGKTVVPYTLGFECAELENKVNKHYGMNWRNKVRQFMHFPFTVNTIREEPIAGTYYARDIFGSIWRKDKLPGHIETPALVKPSFDGYTFPTLDDFIAPIEKANGEENASMPTTKYRSTHSIMSLK